MKLTTELKNKINSNDHNYPKKLWEDVSNDRLAQSYLPKEVGFKELVYAKEASEYDRKHRITENKTKACNTIRKMFEDFNMKEILGGDENRLSPVDRDIKEIYCNLLNYIEENKGTEKIDKFINPTKAELERLRDEHIFDKIYEQSR